VESGERSDFVGLDGTMYRIEKLVDTPPGRCAEVALEELFFNWVVPTASIMFRRSLVQELPDWYYKSLSGDHALQLILARHGPALYCNRHMSVWRRHPGGLSRKCTGLLHQRNWARMHDNFNAWCGYAYDPDLAKRLGAEFRQTARQWIPGEFRPFAMLQDQHLSNRYRRRQGGFSIFAEMKAWAGWLLCLISGSASG
jgi:hypothetical protein